EVDDPALGPLDVVVGGLEEVRQDGLDVLADVAGLGQRRRVGDGEGDVEDAGERAGQQRLPRAGRPDEEDVALLELDVVVVVEVVLGVEPLVVVVDGDGEGALGAVLPDDVLVEGGLDLARGEAAVGARAAAAPALGRGGGVGREVGLDDAAGVVDAPVADVDLRGVRAGHHRGDLVGGAAAERAADDVVADGVHRGRGRGWRPGGGEAKLRNRIELRSGEREEGVKGDRKRTPPVERCSPLPAVVVPLPEPFVARLGRIVPPDRLAAVLASLEAPGDVGFPVNPPNAAPAAVPARLGEASSAPPSSPRSPTRRATSTSRTCRASSRPSPSPPGRASACSTSAPRPARRPANWPSSWATRGRSWRWRRCGPGSTSSARTSPTRAPAASSPSSARARPTGTASPRRSTASSSTPPAPPRAASAPTTPRRRTTGARGRWARCRRSSGGSSSAPCRRCGPAAPSSTPRARSPPRRTRPSSTAPSGRSATPSRSWTPGCPRRGRWPRPPSPPSRRGRAGRSTRR